MSVVDRRRILRKNIGRQLFCKFDDGSTARFLTENVTEDLSLQGTLLEHSPGQMKTPNMTAMFRVEDDTYFIASRVLRQGARWRIASTPDFFLLNRRETHRVSIPANFNLNLRVTHIGKQTYNVVARMLDFSAGGIRVRWVPPPLLREGETLYGFLRWLRDREVPVTLEVRHKTKDGNYGMRFLGLDVVDMNRFKMMSVELQQLIYFK